MTLFGICRIRPLQNMQHILYALRTRVSYEWSYDRRRKITIHLKNYFADIKQLVGEDAIIYMLPREPYYGPDNKPFAAIKSYV